MFHHFRLNNLFVIVDIVIISVESILIYIRNTFMHSFWEIYIVWLIGFSQVLWSTPLMWRRSFAISQIQLVLQNFYTSRFILMAFSGMEFHCYKCNTFLPVSHLGCHLQNFSYTYVCKYCLHTTLISHTKSN